jgi:hypothetical protein
MGTAVLSFVISVLTATSAAEFSSLIFKEFVKACAFSNVSNLSCS